MHGIDFGGVIIHIVIIDDGINEKLYNIGSVRFNLEVGSNLSIFQRKEYDPFAESHGTICAAIIKRYSPVAEISSIKILDNITMRGKKEQLVSALKWCLERNIKLIHLSVGTIDFRDFDEIRTIIYKLYLNECIIVAAYNNKNVFTLPAGLSFVIGVQCDLRFIHNQFSFFAVNGLNSLIRASGRHRLTDYLGNKSVTPPTNSYAAPLITSLVSQVIEETNLNDILMIMKRLELMKGFIQTESKVSFAPVIPDFIERAVVIGFDKNVLLQEHLTFSVVKWIKVEAIAEIAETRDFVCLIINTDSLSEDHYISLLHSLPKVQMYIKGILYCGQHGAPEHIEYFENVTRLCWNQKHYADSFLSVDIDEQNKEIKIPCIFVYGTRTHLIHFLKHLKSLFEKDGYFVKIAGQFEYAYLYGFDFIDKIENRLKVINCIIQLFECDLIICGIETDEDKDTIIYSEADVSIIIGGSSRPILPEFQMELIKVDNSSYEACRSVYDKILALLN